MTRDPTAEMTTGEADAYRAGQAAAAGEGADPIVAAVKAELDARSVRGQAKYGTTLARQDLSTAEWVRHAYEEALDLALYLRRMLADLNPQPWGYGWTEAERAAREPAWRELTRAAQKNYNDHMMAKIRAAYRFLEAEATPAAPEAPEAVQEREIGQSGRVEPCSICGRYGSCRLCRVRV